MKDQEALIGRVEGAHTPGPWHVEPVTGEDDEQFWSDDWNGKVWCVCHPQTQCNATCVIDWINEGDARLIAAAPDFAEAAPNAADLLEQYAGFIRDDVKADDIERHPYLPLIEQTAADLRAAMAKATGARLRTDPAS
jgi:hypothetical protein